MAEAGFSSNGGLFRPKKVARAVCASVLLAAVITAGIQAAIALMDSPDEIAYPSVLPQWMKVLDDHGLWVLYVLDAAQRTGERDPIALASREGIDVARYYLLPRPVYVLRGNLPETPFPSRSFIVRRESFFVEKGIRWLIWGAGPTAQRPNGKPVPPPPRLLDVRKLLERKPDAGVALIHLPSSVPPNPASDYLVAILVVAAVVGLGWLLRPLVTRGDEPATWSESLPRLFALGLLALYALCSGLLLLGIGLSHGLVLFGGLGLLAALSVLRLAWGRKPAVSCRNGEESLAPRGEASPSPRATEGSQSAIGNRKPPVGFRGVSLIRVAALALLGLSFLLVVGKALVMPVRNVDALHHWGFAAKVLFYEGGLRNSAYLDPDRGYDFRRYPLLTPTLLSTIHLVLGRVNDQAVKAVFPAFFGMMLLALYGAMQRERPGVGGALWLACLAACMAYLDYGGGAVSELADVPLSFFLLLGLVEWRRWLTTPGPLPKVSHLREGILRAPSRPEGVSPSGKAEERGIPSRRCETFGRDEGEAPAEPSSLLRWLLPLCGAAVTKTEGLVALAAALAVGAFLRRRARPVPWAAMATAAAAVAVLVLPWYAFASQLPGRSVYVAERPLSETLARNLPQLLPNIGQILAEATDYGVWGHRREDPPDGEEGGWERGHWGLFWICVGVAVVLGWRRSAAGDKLVLGLLALQFASYLLSYVLTPLDPVGLAQTTKMRLLLHLAPSAAYLAWVMLPRLPSWLEPGRGADPGS